ncbi:MAG: GTPase Era [Desulfatiglandales bacterium]
MHKGENPLKSEYLSAFIAIVGPPNVGKSTLLNRLLGAKVAIVSPRPQTTRNRILGVCHGDGYQMVFIDTPGIHRTRTPLHRSMVASAQAAFAEVDIIVMMIDMLRPDDPAAVLILKELKRANKTALLVINKIDKGPPEILLPIIADYSGRYPFVAVVPASALTGKGIGDLMEELKARLRPGPVFFPPDMKTDQSDAFLMAEMIRERIYLFCRKELPYSSAVTVENIQESQKNNLMKVSAVIHVESDSQKAIVIGHQGRMIKKIGQSARREIENRFGIHVFLDLVVRVEKNWGKDPKALKRLGY